MAVHPNDITVISLCTGGGGLDLGVDLALGGRARSVCMVEREAFGVACLVEAMRAGHLAEAPVWSDVRSFDGRPWRGAVDLVCGGYPCQPFSSAGKRRGEADPRHLWPDIARIIGETEPGIVFFENVAGHLTLGFDAVRADLASLGYRVAAGLFTAEEVGAPHRRERLFILGVANGGRDGGSVWRSTRDVRGEAHEAQDEAQERQRRGNTASDAGPAVADPRSIPLFPPGPGDLAAWRRVLADRPDLAPATQPGVRRVDDGMAGRLDRLRMLGNGVCPLAAAYAFVSLWACLERHGG